MQDFEKYKNKYNRDNYKQYVDIDTDEYKLVIDTNILKTYISKLDSLKTISITNRIISNESRDFLSNDSLVNIKNEEKSDSLLTNIEYKYDNIPHRDNGPAKIMLQDEKIIKCCWHNIKGTNIKDPSIIDYDSYDGEINCLIWTNNDRRKSRYDGPAVVHRFGNGVYYRYYIDGLHYEGYKYKEFIKKIKNGTVEKNINRYSDKKIEIIRNLAEFYNLQSLKDTIDNVIMIKKLQGIIKDY